MDPDIQYVSAGGLVHVGRRHCLRAAGYVLFGFIALIVPSNAALAVDRQQGLEAHKKASESLLQKHPR